MGRSPAAKSAQGVESQSVSLLLWLRLTGWALFGVLTAASLRKHGWPTSGLGAVMVTVLALGVVATSLGEALGNLGRRSSARSPRLLDWTSALLGYAATSAVLVVADTAAQLAGAAFLMCLVVLRTLGAHRDERATVEVTTLWIALGLAWFIRGNDTPLFALVLLGVFGAALAVMIRRTHPARSAESPVEPGRAPAEVTPNDSEWAEHDSMLHDLSNAMTASLFIVRDLTRTLDKRTEPGLGRAKSLAQALAREVSEIAEHIRSTRRSGRSQPAASETLKVLEPVERCVEIVARLHPEVACRVEYEPAAYEPIISINGGEATLKRIVENLVLNACQAQISGAKPEPEVVCRIAVTEASVSLAIEDKGPGFPDVVLNAFPSPISLSTKPQGTGIGLYSCHQLVIRDGGNLALSNLSDGGARVVIAWPRVAANRDAPGETKTSQVAISGTRPRHEPVIVPESLVAEKQ